MSLFISAAALLITGGTFWLNATTAKYQDRRYVWLRVLASACWVLGLAAIGLGVLIVNGTIQ